MSYQTINENFRIRDYMKDDLYGGIGRDRGNAPSKYLQESKVGELGNRYSESRLYRIAQSPRYPYGEHNAKPVMPAHINIAA